MNWQSDKQNKSYFAEVGEYKATVYSSGSLWVYLIKREGIQIDSGVEYDLGVAKNKVKEILS